MVLGITLQMVGKGFRPWKVSQPLSRILIVDDDQELRQSLQEILIEAGYSVAIARDGEEALECIREENYDLLLLDMIMPGLSGMETLLILHRKYPQLKIIMVSAFSTVDNAVEAMRHGATDFLTKPFKINDLLTTVRRVFEEARFRECKAIFDVEDTFNLLSNVIRRQILLLLKKKGKQRFMDITRDLKIEDHTKVNFHLKGLKEGGLVQRDEQKYYELSAEGKKITNCLDIVIDNLMN